MSNPPARFKPLLEFEPFLNGHLIEPMCASGRVICQARRGSPDGPQVELPAEAWLPSQPPGTNPFGFGDLRVRSENYASRIELREERVRARDGTITLKERLVAVEIWYEPRFALADSIPPVQSQRDRAAARKAVERWIQDKFGEMPAAQIPNRFQVFELARAELGDWVKPTWIKELKPPSKAGRRKSGGK
jgi:hypothetical protein